MHATPLSLFSQLPAGFDLCLIMNLVLSLHQQVNKTFGKDASALLCQAD